MTQRKPHFKSSSSQQSPAQSSSGRAILTEGTLCAIWTKSETPFYSETHDFLATQQAATRHQTRVMRVCHFVSCQSEKSVKKHETL